jgi:hypothetical protein
MLVGKGGEYGVVLRRNRGTERAQELSSFKTEVVWLLRLLEQYVRLCTFLKAYCDSVAS